MVNTKTVFYLKLIFLVLLIIAIAFAFKYMFGDASKCQNNPFTYGADKIADKWDGNIQCECMFYGNEKKINAIGVKQKEFQRFSFKNKGFNVITYDIIDYNNISFGVLI